MLRRRSCTGGNSSPCLAFEKNTQAPPVTELVDRNDARTCNHSRFNMIGGELSIIVPEA
jgi:hypothetical protein